MQFSKIYPGHTNPDLSDSRDDLAEEFEWIKWRLHRLSKFNQSRTARLLKTSTSDMAVQVLCAEAKHTDDLVRNSFISSSIGVFYLK
jgi:hypothetical protein